MGPVLLFQQFKYVFECWDKKDTNRSKCTVKSVCLENTLARKYYCISIKVMAGKRRQALPLQEYEELAEVVREYPCLYDKAKKGV